MSEWTQDREDLCRKLWADGLTGTQIASRLGGVTRNAVIGKVHRLGLPARAPRQAPRHRVRRISPIFRPTRLQLPPTARPKVRAATPRSSKQRSKAEVAAILASLPETPAGLRIDLLDLREHMCRWPIGDPKDDGFHFCGRQKAQGISYCDPHADVAFQGVRR
jgi:GcrA cell cycle regulator